MTGRISTEAIQQVHQIDLAGIASRYVRLQKRGRASWACCPFHADKSPSLKIEAGRFHCFGCSVRGDSIEFVRRIESVGFRQAIEILIGHAATTTILPDAPAAFQHHISQIRNGRYGSGAVGSRSRDRRPKPICGSAAGIQE